MSVFNDNSIISANSSAEPGCIANNIPYKFFRLGVETKGLLTKKGSLYVGTGRLLSPQPEITLEDGTVFTCDIPETTHLDPPTSQGSYVLTCTVDANGEATLVWQSSNS